MEKEYQSKYTEDKITAAQYLVDIACERIAKREKETLPREYWRLDKWLKHFKRQIIAANALLKEFSCKEIVDALNSYRGKNIYSLGLKKPISEIINSNKIKGLKADQVIVDDMWTEKDEDVFNVDYHGESFRANKKKSTWEELQ
jgi:hypothetical protein